MKKNGILSARDEIIQRAVLEKLSAGVNFFTCDDILTVAEISDAQLKAIAESIRHETQSISDEKKSRETKKPASKRKSKAKT